jgi:hypothetical protein
MATGLLLMRMEERTDLQHKGLKGRRIAWSHFGSGRPHQEYSADAVTNIAGYSQQSGEVR